jgi:hypothetical protein
MLSGGCGWRLGRWSGSRLVGVFGVIGDREADGSDDPVLKFSDGSMFWQRFDGDESRQFLVDVESVHGGMVEGCGEAGPVGGGGEPRIDAVGQRPPSFLGPVEFGAGAVGDVAARPGHGPLGLVESIEDGGFGSGLGWGIGTRHRRGVVRRLLAGPRGADTIRYGPGGGTTGGAGDLVVRLATGVGAPGMRGVDNCQVYRSGRHVQAADDLVDVVQPVLGGKGADDRGGSPSSGYDIGCAVLTEVAAEPVVDEGGRQRPGVVECGAQRGGAVTFEQLGRVGTGGKEHMAGVVTARGELPVGAFGGMLPGGVGVGGDDDAGPSGADGGT